MDGENILPFATAMSIRAVLSSAQKYLVSAYWVSDLPCELKEVISYVEPNIGDAIRAIDRYTNRIYRATVGED